MLVPPRRLGPAVAFAVLTVAGCGDPEGVRTYTAPRSTEASGRDRPALPPGHPEVGAVAAGEVRFLGAQIGIPARPGESYFVRLLGPADRVTAVEKQFDAFLASIRVPGEGGKPISYTPPPGGREGPANAMRVVTYTLDAPGGGVEMYLSVPFGGDLLDNVNRWRVQSVGLEKVTKDQLPAVVTEMPLGAAKAYKVDFRGPGGKGGGMGPMMGGKR